MKNTLVLLSILFLQKQIFSCSPTPGYKFATLKDQVRNASAIMHGKVTEILSGDGINEATVQFSVKKYLKGCGDKSVVVSGFQGSSLCGSGVPSNGDEMVLFVCMDNPVNQEMSNSLQNWKINNFSISTGALFLKYNFDNLAKVSKLTDKKAKGFNDCSSMGLCLKTKDSDNSNQGIISNENSEKSKKSQESEDSDDLEDFDNLDNLEDFEDFDDLEDFGDFNNLLDFDHFKSFNKQSSYSNFNKYSRQNNY